MAKTPPITGTPSRRAAYRDLFERLSDATFLIQKSPAIVLEINPAAERFLGVTQDQIVGKDLAQWVEASQREEFAKSLRQAARKYYPRLFGTVFQLPEGQTFFMEIQACPLTVGETESVLQVIARDVTFKHQAELDLKKVLAELKTANARLEDLSTHDAMTGLWNYRTFAAKIDEEHIRSSRYSKPYSIVYCDLDHFKNFNDKNGHPAGDALLRKVAAIIAESCRNTDLPCRYGGEEFAILCPETDANGARIVGDRIQREIEKTVFEHGENQPAGKVTISIGVAGYPENGDQWQAVLESADKALYTSKHGGRNRVTVAKATGPSHPVPTRAVAAKKKAA